TFTITSLSTSSSPDSILLVVSVNPDTVMVSTTTIPSATGITFDSSPRSTNHPSGSSMDLEEWHGVASGTLSAVTITITLTGTSTNRWLLICDAYQSAPRYFKVEPETSASLTGTPSSAANGFSGTGWVYDVAGIQNGLFDIQSGTWQIDLTGAVGSTTGNPVA